ncbi:MAG: beta-ketoacyl-ACP reductase, partial [Solirubrobacterales bacterium 70-9]
AARLGRGGWAVLLADLDGEAAEAAAAELEGIGILATAAQLDVVDPDAVNALVESLNADGPPILGLVNNAGVLRDARLTEMSDEDFRLVLDVVLCGAFYTSRAVAPAMIEAGHGRIVNITSRAYLGNPGQANYSAAKAGLVGLTKALAKELGRHEITVNAVAPGMTETEMVLNHPKSAEIIERAAKANSIRRIGAPDDIAAAVSYLFSDGASFLTGDVLHVSGGRFS